MSEAVDTLCWQLRAADAPAPVLEHTFAKAMGRRWRFDLAWPSRMLAAEVDGGSWVGGRHTTGTGFEADAEKLSAAAALGWRVCRFTPRMIRDGKALTLVLAALSWEKAA
jgi:very-short-patch-repair endonuclease